MPRLHIPFLRLPSKLRRRARRSRIFTMILLLLTTIVILSPFYIIYKPPSLLIRYFSRRWPDVLFHVTTTKKIVALTIDDGPSEYSREILEVLRENGVEATWFIIGGQVPGREDVLKDMVDGGMELGNHAMHDEPSMSLSDSELEKQIGGVERFIKDAYEKSEKEGVRGPPRYFRPGSGFFSERMRGLLKRLGYRIVLGDIYPHDPQIPYWRVNARHILSMLKPGGIIICHDRRSWTVPMLRKVVPEIKRRGYEIVTVTRLLEETKEIE